MNASTSISESPNPSAIRFGLEGRVALITLLEKAADGISGKTGTRVHQ